MKTFCKTCGKEFSIRPYLVKSTGNCCSRDCRKFGKEIACDCCGKIFYKKKVFLTSQRNFCSSECSKKNTVFKKGNDPWNKDLKGIHLSISSEFKKDKISLTKCPIGTVKVRVRNRDNRPRAFIKICQPNKWELRAKWIWMIHHGEIPKGYVIHHKDRDTLNDSIENLECLTRSEHILEHSQDLNRW